MANNAEKKSQARAQREQAEAQAKAAQQRTRRLQILGGVVVVVVVVVGLFIALNGKKSGPGSSADVQGVPETNALLKGIPQNGTVLGDPKAKTTIVEIGDVQCPFCKQHELDQQPTVIKELVRTGKARLKFLPYNLAFMGEDSIAGQSVALRLSHQNKMFNFLNLFYFNQGEEQTGYVTPKFLTNIVGAIPVANPSKYIGRTTDPQDKATVAEVNNLVNKVAWPGGSFGTPSFLVGDTGKPEVDYTPVELTGGGNANDIIKTVNANNAKLGVAAAASTPSN